MCLNGLRQYRRGQTIIEWLISLFLAIYFLDSVVLERLSVMVDLILLTLIFRTLLQKYGVHHRVMTPYHPQANSQVEVRNREVNNIFNVGYFEKMICVKKIV